MFAMGVVIAAAILFGWLLDLLNEKNRMFRWVGVMMVLMCVTVFFVSPVRADQSDSVSNKLSINLGPLDFSITIVPEDSSNFSPESLKVFLDSLFEVLSNELSISLDSSELPPESVKVLLDSLYNLLINGALEIVDSEIMQFDSLDSLTKDSLMGIVDSVFKKVPIVKSATKGPGTTVIRTTNAGGSNEKLNRKSGGMKEFFASFFEPISDMFALGLIFLFVLLLILGVPIILGLLLYYKWHWIHQERMKALEMGIALSPETKNGISRLRTGMAILGLGAGIALGVLLHQGFWFLLGTAFLGWGLGLVAGYYLTRQEKDREPDSGENQIPGGESQN